MRLSLLIAALACRTHMLPLAFDTDVQGRLLILQQNARRRQESTLCRNSPNMKTAHKHTVIPSGVIDGFCSSAEGALSASCSSCPSGDAASGGGALSGTAVISSVSFAPLAGVLSQTAGDGGGGSCRVTATSTYIVSSIIVFNGCRVDLQFAG